MAETSKMIRASSCPRGQMVLRVTKDLEGSEDHLVATKDIGKWMAVMPTLFKAAPSEDYEWWYPTPKGVGDAWAPLVLGDGHRLSLEAWCDKWKKAPKRSLNLALEDDWRHVIEAWDHGCKSRYRSRARKCGKQLAQRLSEGHDLEAALNACWEFAHEPSNATSCGSLARRVASNVSSEDPAIRIAACRAAWRLCEADEGICRELVRRGLASALVEAVERNCDVALGCLVALAHRDDAVRTDVLASERGLRALVTSAALFRSTLALGGLLFGVTVASSEVREYLCVASDIEEEIVMPEPELKDAPAPAPDEIASAPAPAVTASSGALAALAPLLATEEARLAAATVGVLASDPALTGVYPGATACVDACALLVERSLNEEDFETAHIAAKAADACASLKCEEVPDVERLLELTKRCVDLTQPKVARAVASAHARVIARGVSYQSVEKWILSVLGELLPSLDERVTRALPEAIKTENGRKAALSTKCFRVLCELLKSETYTSQVLEPVACSLEILSRGGYDPCSVVLKPNAWNDVSHVQPFIDSFALTGKAYRDNRERRNVVGFGAIAVARLARHWALACSNKGKYPKDSPLLKRKCLGTLCAITRLLAEGGVDAFTCAAGTALRILLLGAASIPKPSVGELLDRGAVEKAVVSVLTHQSPEEQMDMRDENGVQARREMLELVWKLTKDNCEDVEASRIDARGFGPALVKPLCVLLRSDHARSPSSDSKELTGAACRVLLRLCCETAVGARELEQNGSDVVTEVLRCLEPGNNALIQETALFSVQLLAARDRRLGVRLAKQGSKRIAALLSTEHAHDVRKAALHALLNLSVAKDACWPVAKYALEPTLDASDEPSELRTYAVSLLANLSRDARVCYQIHLRKLRVDFGNCERKKLTKLNKPSQSSITSSLRNKLTKYDNVQRLFEDSVCTVRSTDVVSNPIDLAAANERRLEAKRQLAAMPNSLWTQPKGDKTIRKMLKDAVQRPRTAPLLSRGGVQFETPLLREAPRMGSFRVGPAHDKGGVSPWNPVVARGAAAPKLGKRCVLAPGGARNTFRFPPGLATGNDGETQLCCFKSCVGAKLYVGDCPTFFLPRKRDDEVDDVPEDELVDGPEVSAASKALRNLSFAKAVDKFKATLDDKDDDETEYTAYHLFRSTRVACEVLHPGQWRDGTPPPGWVPDQHENEFAMVFMEKPPSCILVRAPFPPHAPSVTRHYMSELEHAPTGSWGRLAPCPLCLFCTKRPPVIVEEDVPVEPESTWTLEASIWAPRKLESDAKDFYDTPKVLHRGFAKDWTYLTNMPRFPNFAKRLAGYSMRDAKEAPASVIEAIKHGAEVLYGALLPILKHYAAVDLASNNAFDLNMTDWIAYLRATDCFDDDENSPTHFTPEHAQIVFRQCKVEIGVSKEMRAVNDDEHLCRYEFLDANLRVVEAKYDLDHEPPDSHSREDHILESVERFRDEHLSKLPYELHECPDTFRRESLYNEEVDIQLWKYDKILKGIWRAYGNQYRHAGRAKFSPNVFAEFLTKCMLCHNSDARVAARRSFAFGRTFFVDTCDAGYKELTYINFLEALCRFVHVEVEVPLFGHLREIGVNELCEFYEILHFRATNGADAVHAINELRRMLTPDTELTLAEKLALVLPHMLACFSVTCGGDFETKLDHVRLNTLLSEEQKQKWIKKKCHISRGDCEHVLALDEFKAVTHAVDKKHVFAEAVQLKKSAEKGVSDGAGVW